MKTSLPFFVVFAIFSLLAHASEEKWAARTLILPTLRNEVHGYTTDKGSFRIEALDFAQSRLKVSGGYFARKPQVAGTLCRSLGDSLQITKQSSKNFYHMKSFVYPLAQSEINHVRASIENPPGLYNFGVNLATGPESIVTPSSKADFEKRAKLAIEDQMEHVKQTGEFEIEMGQMDDIACDLILGNSKLEIHFGLMLEDAKHTRQTVLTATEFQKIYEATRNTGVKTRVVSQRNTYYAGIISQALLQQLGKSSEEFGEEGFLNLSATVLDFATGKLRDIPAAQYEATARSLDILKLQTSRVLLKTTLDAEAVGENE